MHLPAFDNRNIPCVDENRQQADTGQSSNAVLGHCETKTNRREGKRGVVEEIAGFVKERGLRFWETSGIFSVTKMPRQNSLMNAIEADSIVDPLRHRRGSN